ncbi:hypothetical protein A3B40_05975 [Candidatus Roizmanbacteria bacterium RIFCSPLOWO2_01_FULL_37_16]|uniref:Uncharacterized protein n=1 Tax=Candidatus Roizmanbacteria bacterium RIFCSPLOWO2_01_FULL_37_16 TaxID=1802058 RepID=A0A1F7IQ01_9BACT|nr:MAG: hypothetical protein A3B40_05975 [Candidatus Roizmanbacteria bacterium RIFCSPLOWO2_01_FULL_37_16]
MFPLEQHFPTAVPSGQTALGVGVLVAIGIGAAAVKVGIRTKNKIILTISGIILRIIIFFLISLKINR